MVPLDRFLFFFFFLSMNIYMIYTYIYDFFFRLDTSLNIIIEPQYHFDQVDKLAFGGNVNVTKHQANSPSEQSDTETD